MGVIKIKIRYEDIIVNIRQNLEYLELGVSEIYKEVDDTNSRKRFCGWAHLRVHEGEIHEVYEKWRCCSQRRVRSFVVRKKKADLNE